MLPGNMWSVMDTWTGETTDDEATEFMYSLYRIRVHTTSALISRTSLYRMLYSQLSTPSFMHWLPELCLIASSEAVVCNTLCIMVY